MCSVNRLGLNTPYSFNNKQKVANQPVISLPVVGGGQYSGALPAQYTQMKLNEFNIAPNSYAFLGVQRIFDKHNAYMYQLSNGQRVAIVPKKGQTVVKSYVNVGSLNEPDNLRGISHYIEHNLFNGTKGNNNGFNLAPGEFFKKTTEMGADTNASTNFSITDYFISSNLLDTEDLNKKITMHADMLQNPKFDELQLEKEKGPVISEISMILDSPENIALNTCLKNLFNIQSKSTDIVAGSIDNIKNMTKNDVEGYYNTWYTPDNSVTVITGEVDPASTIALLAQNFNKKVVPNYHQRRYEPLIPLQTSKRVDLESNKIPASIITLGFVGPQNNDARAKLALEALILYLTTDNNSPLKAKLEETFSNAAMSVERMANYPNAPKAVILQAQTSPEKQEQVLQDIYSVIHKVATIPPSLQETEFIKNKMKMGLDDINESSHIINNIVGNALLDNDLNSLGNISNLINFITPADISLAAQKFLDLNKTSISVVRPSNKNVKTTTNSNIAFKGIQNKKVYDENNILEYKLNNNIEVVVEQNTSLKNNFLLTLENQTLQNSKPGVEDILSMILNEGTALTSKEDFCNLKRFNNIDLGVELYNDKLEILSTCPSTTLNTALEIAKQKIYNPDFSSKTFELAKKMVKAQYAKIPLSVFENLSKELFPHLKYGYTTKEILNNIDSISLDDVKNYYYNLLNNSQMKIVANTSPQNISIINNSLSTLPIVKPFIYQRANIFTPLVEDKIITQVEQRNQAMIARGFKFKTNHNLKDNVTIKLLNTILGASPQSRLFSDLRENQKLAYHTSSKLKYIQDTGTLTLFIATTTDNPQEGDKTANLQKSLDGFQRNIDKLKNELCSKEELEMAKKIVKNDILKTSEQAISRIFSIAAAKNSAYGINSPNETLKVIDTITPEDIKNAANYVFNQPSITSILASQKTIDSLNK